MYTIAEAARALDVPATTLSTWAFGYVRRPPGRQEHRGDAVVTAFPSAQGPSIPFVGLAEGMVLAAVRRSGVSLQRVRPALVVCERHGHRACSRLEYGCTPMVLSCCSTMPHN